jgi:23S rRNA pseudouridine2605 synthase
MGNALRQQSIGSLSRGFHTSQTLFDVKPSSETSIATLNAFLSKHGVASRRKAVDLVTTGLVKVNGAITTNPGYRVQVSDIVEVDDKVISGTEKIPSIVLMMNKPAGYECTRKPQGDNQTIFDLIDETKGFKFMNVGRLDLNSEGLLLLTTDGALCHNIIHPSSDIEKEYYVRTRDPLSPDDVRAMTLGLHDDGDLLFAKRVQELHNHYFNYSVTLSAGRKREVRRLIMARGNHVFNLKRVRLGGLEMGDLPVGGVRVLRPEEIDIIFQGKKHR